MGVRVPAIITSLSVLNAYTCICAYLVPASLLLHRSLVLVLLLGPSECKGHADHDNGHEERDRLDHFPDASRLLAACEHFPKHHGTIISIRRSTVVVSGGVSFGGGEFDTVAAQ